MSQIIRRKLFWNEAGTSGLIVGTVLGLSTLAVYLLRNSPDFAPIVNNLISLFAFIILPFVLGKRFSKKNALWGLTFQRALSFMMVMYLLSGFIYGIATYLVYQIDTQYFVSITQEVADTLKLPSDKNISLEQTINDPLQVAFGFTFTLPFLTFLPAMIIAAIIKRAPAIRDFK